MYRTSGVTEPLFRGRVTPFFIPAGEVRSRNVFSEGEQQALELFMRQKPRSDRFNPVVPKMMKIAGLAVSTTHNGGIACTAFFKDMQSLYMKSKRGK